MVHLTRIYTRTGDRGTTRLVNNAVTDKTDPRVEAYGAVDELNSLLGVVLTIELSADLREKLGVIQQELFDLGADLANPVEPASAPADPSTGAAGLTATPDSADDPAAAPAGSTAATPALRIDQASVTRLETWCDELGAGLPPLDSFLLPGGSPAGAHLHLARTVCRRAERRAWVAVAGEPDGCYNPLALTYLNRLSDFLFIASRVANGAGHEVLWAPGGQR